MKINEIFSPVPQSTYPSDVVQGVVVSVPQKQMGWMGPQDTQFLFPQNPAEAAAAPGGPPAETHGRVVGREGTRPLGLGASLDHMAYLKQLFKKPFQMPLNHSSAPPPLSLPS